MSATMPQLHPHDPAVPMTERFGGRFLSAVELETADLSHLEMLHMNLTGIGEAYFAQWRPDWIEKIPPVTPDQFGGLLAYTRFVRTQAEQMIEWADEIAHIAHLLYRNAMDADPAARAAREAGYSQGA